MPSFPREPAKPRPKAGDALEYVAVPLEDCERSYSYGTIRYRECRARAADRLRKACIEYQQKADRANGDLHQQLRVLARSYCRESDRYRVTD